MNATAGNVANWLNFIFGGYIPSSGNTMAGGVVDVQPGTQWYRCTGTVTCDLSQAGLDEGEIYTFTLVGIGTMTIAPASGVLLVSPTTGLLVSSWSVTQANVLAFTTVTFAWDSTEGAWVFIGMSASGAASGGTIVLPTITATPGAPIGRVGPKLIQPVNTNGGACGFTVSGLQVNDQVGALDAARCWGTAAKQFTFHGDGTHFVEDPFNQSAPLTSLTWTSPVGFSDLSVNWILLVDPTLGTYLKAL